MLLRKSRSGVIGILRSAMSWLSFTARRWFSAALTIARRCDGRAWNVSHTKFLSPISKLQPKSNPASCHFSCVQIEIELSSARNERKTGAEGEGEMRAARLQELKEMLAMLLETARELPPGQDHHNALQEIARFRARIIGLQRQDLRSAHRKLKAKGK